MLVIVWTECFAFERCLHVDWKIFSVLKWFKSPLRIIFALRLQKSLPNSSPQFSFLNLSAKNSSGVNFTSGFEISTEEVWKIYIIQWKPKIIIFNNKYLNIYKNFNEIINYLIRDEEDINEKYELLILIIEAYSNKKLHLIL